MWVIHILHENGLSIKCVIIRSENIYMRGASALQGAPLKLPSI